MTTILSNGSLYDNDSYFDTPRIEYHGVPVASRLREQLAQGNEWNFEIDGLRYSIDSGSRELFWDTLLTGIENREISSIYENVVDRNSQFSFYLEILFRQDELEEFDSSMFIKNLVYVTQGHLRREIPRSFHSENLKVLVCESELEDIVEGDLELSRYVLLIKVPFLSLEPKKIVNIVDLVNAEMNMKKIWRQLIPIPYSSSEEEPESLSWRPYECKARWSTKRNSYPIWPTSQKEEWPICNQVRVISFITPDAMENDEVYSTLICGMDELLDHFPLKYHEDIREDRITLSNFIDSPPVTFLPLICSSGYKMVIERKKYKRSYQIYDDEITFFSDEDRVVEMLLDMIPQERYKERSFLIVVGKSLFNVYNGSDTGLSVWKERMSTDLVQSIDPRRKWIEWRIHRSSPKGIIRYTMKTIMWFAYKSSSESFEAWQELWALKEVIDSNSSKLSQVSVSRFVTKLLFLHIMYSHGKWFIYNGKNWEEHSESDRIKLYIEGRCNNIIGHLVDVVSNTIIPQLNPGTDEEDSNDPRKMILTALYQLRSSTTSDKGQREIINTMRKYFYDPSFDYLDSNLDILPVQNGTIMFDSEGAVLRESLPEDFCTMVAPTPLILGSECPGYSEMHTWLLQIFGNDQDTVDLFLSDHARAMVGGNIDKLLILWLGTGNNGKSALKGTFEDMLQYLCKTMPKNAVMFQSRGGPTPELARLKGARYAFICEIDMKDKLSESIIKAMTGGDNFFARKNHQDGGELTPSATLIFMANKYFLLPCPDQAMQSRIRAYPFNSRWSSEASDSIEEQMRTRIFKKDPFFRRNTPKYAPGLLKLLFESYNRSCKESIPMSEQMIQAREEFMNRNDPFRAFYNEFIEPVFQKETSGLSLKQGTDLDMGIRLFVSELKERFSIWVAEKFEDIRPSEDIIVEEFGKRIGTKIETISGIKFWRGYRMKVKDTAGFFC